MDTIVKQEALNKGWSTDKKFVITTRDGFKILLREAPLSKSKTIISSLKLMKYAQSHGVSLCSPLYYERIGDTLKSYFSWINGVDLKDHLKTLDMQEHYTLGLDAGNYLKLSTMHLWTSCHLIGKKSSLKK